MSGGYGWEYDMLGTDCWPEPQGNSLAHCIMVIYNSNYAFEFDFLSLSGAQINKHS